MVEIKPDYHGFGDWRSVDALMKKINSGKDVKIKQVSEKDYKQATQKYARDYPRNKALEKMGFKRDEIPEEAKQLRKPKKKDNSKLYKRIEKALSKRIVSKRILKQERPTLTIKERTVESSWNEPSLFFKREIAPELSLFLKN